MTELLGRTSTREFVVSGSDTAASVGSGSLPVLGTPVLLAWCEAVTCEVLALTGPQTSVGTRVALEHLAASSPGTVVQVSASVVHVDGRLVRFEVSARDAGSQKLLGTGEVTRVVVDTERFLTRVDRA